MILSSGQAIVVQVEVFSILLVTAGIFLFLFMVNAAIVKSDPLAKPKGLVLIGMLYYEFIQGLTNDNMGKKTAVKYGPYIGAIAMFMAVSNLSGLIGLSQPTANYSVTLTLALITFFLIQSTKIHYNGVWGYIKGFFEPFAPFVVMNLFGLVAPLLSMSLRLFGNITSGGTLMQLFYLFTGFLSSLFPFIGNFNFIGVFLAPFLHSYFDIFSGLIQMYIFIMLTTIFIGNEIPQE